MIILFTLISGEREGPDLTSHNDKCRYSPEVPSRAAWCFDKDNREMECEILPCAGKLAVIRGTTC